MLKTTLFILHYKKTLLQFKTQTKQGKIRNKGNFVSNWRQYIALLVEVNKCMETENN